MFTKFRALVAGAAIALLTALPASAGMITYTFSNLTNNQPGDDLSGQLAITLWSYDMANQAAIDNSWNNYVVLNSSQVLFTVTNNVGISSNIAEVYFDDGLLGPSQIMNSLTGFTNFTGGGADPGNLPGGSLADPVFQASVSFSADVNPGPPSNGVNDAGDTLGIYLGLGTYADFDAVVAAVMSGDLRFGLHVRTIGSLGGGDSYISPADGPSPPDGPPGVPVPGTLLLLGLGLLLLAARARHLQSV